MDRGQRRRKIARVAHVIITDQRNILRDAQAHFISSTKCAHCHDIATTEDGSRAMRLRQDLLHGAITGFRFKVTLHNPAFRHLDHRFFHRLHKTGKAACAGVTFQRAGDDADFAVTAFNQITPGHVAAFERVINDRIGEVSFCFTPVHDHHWDMAILFQHRQQRLWVLRTHHQQTIDAFLRHHRQISPLFLKIVPRIAQNQGVTFLEAIFFNCFNDLGKIGRFAAGRQQTDRLGVVNLQATRHRARGVV
ncbi:hypothetical protein ESCOMMO057M_04680 [Escherichia coli]